MRTLINKENAIGILFWIAFAVLLRVICMFVGVHGDIIYINYYPSKLVHDGVLDVYKFIYLNEDAPGLTYYPPLTYFVIGAFQAVWKLLDSGFYEWIQGVKIEGVYHYLLANGVSFKFLKYIFLMKLPYVFFDVAGLALVLKFLKDAGSKMLALRLWAFNPVILYGAYMFGQIDIIPAVLVLSAVFLITRKRTQYAFFILSAAALIKTFPIFILPPLFVILTRSKKDLFGNIVAMAIPFVLVVVPYFFSSGGIVISSIFPPYSAESVDVVEKACYSVQMVIFMVLYSLLMCSCLRMRKECYDDTWTVRVPIAALMLVYTMLFIPVHYFTWATFFLVIAVCLGILPEWLYWAQIIALFVYNLNGPTTTTALVAPLDPRLFLGLPGLPDIMHKLRIPWGAVMIFARLVFTTVCVLVAVRVIGGSPVIGRIFLFNRSGAKGEHERT